MTAIRPARCLVTAALVLVLTGCSLAAPAAGPSQARRSASNAVADLQRVPGVTNVDIGTSSTGTPWQIELDAGADLDATFTGDLGALFDYVLAQAWSVTTKKPTTTVYVTLSQNGKPVDIVPLAHALGWSYVSQTARNIAVSDMAKRYGKWPGPVPELPEGLTKPSP